MEEFRLGTINETIERIAKITEEALVMEKKIDMLANAFHQWRIDLQEGAKVVEALKAKHAEEQAEREKARKALVNA